MRVLDLFSGIGGFSLGLERAGMQTVAFCEIDPYCRAVLRKHWPEVKQYDDIRTLTRDALDRDGITVDAICGGFPCQDISTAGNGAGIAGQRSGLWKEYARLISELRPQFAIMENVSALLGRGLDVVLGDLAAIGYDAEWHCIPASAIGAPHRRDRIWIIANPVGLGSGQIGTHPETGVGREKADDVGQVCSDLADADATRPQRQWARSKPILAKINDVTGGGWWKVEPNVGRVAHGVPNRAHRLKALGNAVVPQIPEIIGKAIMAAVNSPDTNPGECYRQATVTRV